MNSSAPPRRGRRLLQVAAVLLLLVAVLVALAPALVAPLVRSAIVTAIEERLHATAAIDGLSLSWSGDARLEGLAVDDLEGRPLARVERIDVAAELGPALKGVWRADVVVTGPELHLRRDAEGAWNVQSLLRETGGPGGAGAGGADAPPPDVVASLSVAGGRVVVHGAGGELALIDLATDLRVDGLERPVAVGLEGRLPGAEGRPGVLRVNGTAQLSGAPRFEGDLAVEGLLLDGVPDALGAANQVGTGVLTTALHLLVEGERLTVRGSTVVEELDVTLETGARGPMNLHDPRLALEVDADLDSHADTGLLDVEIRKLELDSTFARGSVHGRVLGLAAAGEDGEAAAPRFEQLEGELHYVPDRVAVLVDPWFPGTLAGEEEQHVTFRLGGTADEPGSTLRLDLNALHATAGLSPVLGYVHPLFAGIDQLEGSQLGGLIDVDLDLAYDAPLDADALAGGWEGLPKTPIHGRGSFAIHGAVLEGSPLLDQLLSDLGVSARELDVDPIELEITAGRITYGKPWQWSLAGSPTTFRGSIGLDRTLDLTWSVPVTAEMARKVKLLDFLVGETLAVPLKGTITSPRLEWKPVLDDLAKTAFEREVVDQLGLEEKLDDLLGDALEKVQGESGDGESPEDLLKRADALWAEGKQAEAAELYRRIREDHKLSPTYLLNRKRIKERAQAGG